MLRALSSDAVFAEVEPRRFIRTPLSDGLRTDAPLTARWIAIAFGAEHYRGWADAFHSFCTGEPAFDRSYGLPYFDYLEQNPDASVTFNRAMGAGTRAASRRFSRVTGPASGTWSTSAAATARRWPPSSPRIRN
jgi:hypothetical protein